MQKIRLLVIMAIIVAAVPGIAWAAPDVVTGFTISPSTAYAGNTVTFRVDFSVGLADLGTRNTLCFYYQDANYDATFAALGNVTSSLGDLYARDVQAVAASPSAHCPGLASYKILEYSTDAANEFADGGDWVSFSFAIPAGATTQAFRLRQRNVDPATVGVFNATLTIQALGSQIYVANDAATCGGNTPCLTGQGALNQAIDGVTTGGTVIVLGAYNMSPSVSADLTDARTVTLAGQGGASLNNAAGACSEDAMVEVSHASATLTVTNLTIDGTCTSGNRAVGVLNTSGTSTVKTGTSTIRDFTGSGNAGVAVVAGTMTVENNTFSNNQTAMEGTGGTLYAFANNVTSNSGVNAATGIDASDNVRCNYWGSAGIDSSAQYLERLGSPIVSYVEGTGSLALGQASLASNGGNQLLINLGRSTSNPPFNNGTVAGLGALASDFFAACGSRGSSMPGAITITGDSVTPGTTGFRLYSITTPADCSPSDNTACWDYQSVSCFTAGCSVTDGAVNAGHFVVGNEVDPTAVTLRDLSATPHAETSGLWAALGIALGLLVLGTWITRRRTA